MPRSPNKAEQTVIPEESLGSVACVLAPVPESPKLRASLQQPESPDSRINEPASAFAVSAWPGSEMRLCGLSSGSPVEIIQAPEDLLSTPKPKCRRGAYRGVQSEQCRKAMPKGAFWNQVSFLPVSAGRRPAPLVHEDFSQVSADLFESQSMINKMFDLLAARRKLVRSKKLKPELPVSSLLSSQQIATGNLGQGSEEQEVSREAPSHQSRMWDVLVGMMLVGGSVSAFILMSTLTAFYVTLALLAVGGGYMYARHRFFPASRAEGALYSPSEPPQDVSRLNPRPA